ncbi:cupin domain-containing protein [Natrialba taiwanensis]|uniref:Cupin 2 barrel domain-containing protein n=1 Tax=Natrialba taiwanensis DSM 12281 TaxID=1230458 RepID=M0ABZ5_9EURY|nr:hypothetical protein [Natrialba taiwanensis]ELY96280.1 Cupin 2 barrel domain-containing protein [Natrialba taiwanensis DSM 12281]
MVDDWEHTSLNDLGTNPEKPGRRWEVSPALGIDEFNFNVAVLEREERLSQNHFHYHENQKELFYVVSGACRVETREEGFTTTEDEFIVFRDGPGGAHPCTIRSTSRANSSRSVGRRTVGIRSASSKRRRT